MKHLLLFFSLQCAGIFLHAQQYSPVDEGSGISFKIRNFGFTVEGTLKGLQGIIRFDPNDLSFAAFDVSVDASTVNTDNELRDSHLKKEEYFDVQHYPRIRFVSTKVLASNRKGTYFLYGNLTIKNVTKELSFPFTATPSNSGWLFNGEFRINRKDFGIGGTSTISDNLTVSMNVFGKKQ